MHYAHDPASQFGKLYRESEPAIAGVCASFADCPKDSFSELQPLIVFPRCLARMECVVMGQIGFLRERVGVPPADFRLRE